MSQAISRESFDELRNYLGVYLQQGRVILDSDWNESQDIAVSFIRRLARESLGDGSPNQGFAIDPVFPPPPEFFLENVDTTGLSPEESLAKILGACIGSLIQFAIYLIFGPILFFLDFPGKELEDFEDIEGFALSSPQGQLRVARDRPYQGEGFLRLSGHPGTVTVTKTLTAVRDLSAFELATFRFRMNHQVPGTMRFFLEDDQGNRSVWVIQNPALAEDLWLAGFAAPLDIRFRILTPALPVAVAGQSYSADLFTFSGTTPMTWQVSAGALPAGLTLQPSGEGKDSAKGSIRGTPTAAGTSDLTVQVTDAAGLVSTGNYRLEVRDTGKPGIAIPSGAEILSTMARTEAPTGTPADLTAVAAYGFELYQDNAAPLMWDLDDLRLGGGALEAAAASDNFIVRGSEFAHLLNLLTLMSIMMSADDGGGGGGGGSDDVTISQLLALLNTEMDLSEPGVQNAGRMYVAGLPCLQVRDQLYSDQADPNDPPLSPPAPGQVRKDTVYLDVWTEPATYVQDPAIREVALGGPDTSTRAAVRHRVRVAQGGDRPHGDGLGKGTLATGGTFTGQANRLYRVEIDTPGDIGVATFRWSEENASAIQRVIEPVPPSSTQVTVEDSAGFRTGDVILIRKEFGAEEHTISGIDGNVLILAEQTGTQLAALPAASRVPDFTAFSLADRPMVQRWNAVRQEIRADPADATVSAAISLNDGVELRFGGRAMRAGDYWTFTTRYLAGDEAAGLSDATRVERLDFAGPRGVVHHYASLAVLTRDGSAPEPGKIFAIEDRRQRVGNAATATASLPDLTALTGTGEVHVGGLRLPPGANDSKLVVFWSGDLFLQDPIPPAGPGQGKATLTLKVSFYNDEMTDPLQEPAKGNIQDRETVVTLDRRAVQQDIPLSLLFAKSDTGFAFLPVRFTATSVQVFARLNRPGFTVQLTNMQVNALELKKST